MYASQPRSRHYTGVNYGGAPRNKFAWDEVTRTQDMTPAVQRHLHRVYIAVIGGIVAYALGAAWSTGSYAEQLEMAFLRRDASLVPSTSWLWILLSIGAGLVVTLGPDMFGASVEVVAGAFALSSFSTGVISSPLLALANLMNPYLVATAAVAAAGTFATLSYVALRSRKRSWLWLGSFLSMGVWGLLLMSPIGGFIGGLLFGPGFREALSSFELYLGLAIFVGYVLFDTQLIIARAESTPPADGYTTRVVQDAFQLFTDLIGIFIRLLVILMKAEEQKKRHEEERRRRR